eukprot:gene369-466_t
MVKKLAIYDNNLLERIEALDCLNQKYNDIEKMTSRLRSLYQEYNRKPFKPFYQQVERAVDILLAKYSKDENNNDQENNNNNNNNNNSNSNPTTPNNTTTNLDEPDAMEEDDVQIISVKDQSKNTMNNILLSSYKKQQTNNDINNGTTTTTSTTTTTTGLGKRSRDVLNNSSNGNNIQTTTSSINNGNITPPISTTTSPNLQTTTLILPTTPTNSQQQPYTPLTTTPKQKSKKLRKDFNNNNSNNSSNNNKVGFIPNVNFSSIGGIESCLNEIRQLIEYPICHPEIYAHLGVEPPRSILLHGPPGCGKTLLAHAIAGELQVPLISISAPEITSGISGESEAKIRNLFNDAMQQAPCIIFIDEIDAIAPKRDTASKDMERRIVAQLLTCMDSLNSPVTNNNNNLNENNNNNNNEQENNNENNNATTTTTTTTKNKGHVMVIGATSRPESIDTGLRRGGRFDKEICLGVPDQSSRAQILKVITSKMRLDPNFDYEEIASLTPGYVGADLNLLAKESAVLSINRIFNHIIPTSDDSSTNNNNVISDFLRFNKSPLSSQQLEQLYIEMGDFKKATKKVQPSAKREGFATIPNVTWDDVGALSGVRDELTNTILRPIKHPQHYKKMGIDSPSGVLMYGPPGCGKTLLAKAIANECQANFISVKGPELLNKYVGESERAVRQVFQRASASSPCVIFFDEFDALAPKRGGGEGSQATERVVNQLLTEMDGLEKRSEVFIIAATNRPDIIDSAVMRPGRLDKLVYVPLPTPEERVDILKTLVHKIPISNDVDLESVGKDTRCHAFSGADLSLLVKEAANRAIGRSFSNSKNNSNNNSIPEICPVSMEDFNYSLTKIKPSVSRKDELMYDKLNNTINKARLQKKDTTTTTTTTTPPTESTTTIEQIQQQALSISINNNGGNQNGNEIGVGIDKMSTDK